MARFEKVSKFTDIDINLPQRKTTASAGYDMEVAEDVVIPSFFGYYTMMREYPIVDDGKIISKGVFNLEEVARITKSLKAKPTLVSTGMKCSLEPNNGVGIVDADYYNNPDNEGEIFFQIINLSPFDIQLRKGDIIGQGIIKPYLTTEDDVASGQRVGGFGSTSV